MFRRRPRAGQGHGTATAQTAPRGIVLRGLIWTGGDAEPFAGRVVLDAAGAIAAIHRDDPHDADRDRDRPADRHGGGPAPVTDLPELGGDGCWVGPGVVDAHVHQAFTTEPAALGPGLVAARDLGAPLDRALRWRAQARALSVSGPILTATGGYPSRSWGQHGFAAFADTPAQAAAGVRRLADVGVDVIKVAIEPGPGWPIPAPATLRAAVDAAHAAGLAVVAHALGVDAVRRALAAGVDELAHTPSERLSDADIGLIADSGVSVVSTLQTFFADGAGRSAAANAADLVSAGVTLRYGTDLGNAGTVAGVDPRELDRLADAGLGRRGALVAATLLSAAAAGVRKRTGRLTVGEPANLVVLCADPEFEPAAWRTPLATFTDGRLTDRPGPG